MPRERSSYPSGTFKRSSLPCRIKAAHSWHFRVNDGRRLRYKSRGPGLKITAVDMTALPLPGM
eukprot:9674809-Prorocentrum_lima.AAC.1